MSPTMSDTSAAPASLMSAMAARAFSALRQTRTSFAPIFPSAIAEALPMPWLAPVMRTVFPFMVVLDAATSDSVAPVRIGRCGIIREARTQLRSG
jgi:hypothetical protein